jgi:PEP-CTERM motif
MTSHRGHHVRHFAAIAMTLSLFAVPSMAESSTILAPNSFWDYSTTANPNMPFGYSACDPTGSATWNTAALGTGGCTWLNGQAPFGNASGNPYNPDFWFNTYWYGTGANTCADDNAACIAANPNDFWVRRTVDFSGLNLATLHWDIGVDNGYTLYLNGIQISTNIGPNSADRWEYSGDFGGAAVAGNNIIALALNDFSGATAFDMQITADLTRQVDPVPAPEPATIALLGMGTALVFASRKRLV